MHLNALGLIPLSALLATSAPAPDPVPAPQIAQLQAEVAQLRSRLDQIDNRPGPYGAEYRLGSPTARRVELRGLHGSIVIDRDGVAIQSDAVRINGKTIRIDATRTLDLSGAAVIVQGDTIDVKKTGGIVIRGSKILEN